MSSPAENKTCGVCLGSVGTGQGQAIFTAECSHSFHFPCIASHGDHLCPVCQAKWNHLPSTMLISNGNFSYNSTSNGPFYNRPSPYSPYHPPPFPSTPVPPPEFPPPPASEQEPRRFSDDEPLSAVAADPMSLDSPVDLERVTLKAIPERPALAASDRVSEFAVLVGLKAPSLSDDALSAQRASADIVTVLDVSGSMFGTKLDLVKRAVHFVIDNLGVSDRLSIVSFSDRATRILPLRRMTENGRADAKRAVSSLSAGGGTNIVEGLRKGARVLGERLHKNSVTSIIFLSDGNDTYNNRSPSFQGFPNARNAPGYLHLLPASVYPTNRGPEAGQPETIPVHSFGFGSDHHPITMHAISDASGGTFSFIESYEMVQDAFAGCIGGLLSVVIQELRLEVRSASHGVEIKSIPSGRYPSEISNEGSEGLVKVGDLYADEEKEFLMNVSVPPLPDDEAEGSERKTSLLDIACSYKDAASKEAVQIEGDLVEIRRPKSLSPQDTVINLEVDRQRNRLCAAESIQQAQQMAETGNLTGAKDLLAKRRSDLLASASARAGDGLCLWLQAEMKETERRMASPQVYQQQGRAYALSGMNAHAFQRATTRGDAVAGAAAVDGFGIGVASASAPPPCPYGTPNMASMVFKSQLLNKMEENNVGKKE